MTTIERLLQRVQFAIGRGRITISDDSGAVQRAQVDLGPDLSATGSALKSNTPLLGLFGHASRPPAGSDVVLVFVGGDRSNGVAIASGHQPSRLTGLAEGDSALYDLRGAYMWLTPNGLVIDGAGLPATIRNVGSLTVDGDLLVTGNITDQSGANTATVKDLRDAYDLHKHTGVTAGSGLTGATDHNV